MAVNAKRTVADAEELGISTVYGHVVLKHLHINPRSVVAIENSLNEFSNRAIA